MFSLLIAIYSQPKHINLLVRMPETMDHQRAVTWQIGTSVLTLSG